MPTGRLLGFLRAVGLACLGLFMPSTHAKTLPESSQQIETSHISVRQESRGGLLVLLTSGFQTSHDLKNDTDPQKLLAHGSFAFRQTPLRVSVWNSGIQNHCFGNVSAEQKQMQVHMHKGKIPSSLAFGHVITTIWNRAPATAAMPGSEQGTLDHLLN